MSQANAPFRGVDPVVLIAAQKELQAFWMSLLMMLMNPFSYIPDWILKTSTTKK